MIFTIARFTIVRLTILRVNGSQHGTRWVWALSPPLKAHTQDLPRWSPLGAHGAHLGPKWGLLDRPLGHQKRKFSMIITIVRFTSVRLTILRVGGSQRGRRWVWALSPLLKAHTHDLPRWSPFGAHGAHVGPKWSLLNRPLGHQAENLA